MTCGKHAKCCWYLLSCKFVQSKHKVMISNPYSSDFHHTTGPWWCHNHPERYKWWIKSIRSLNLTEWHCSTSQSYALQRTKVKVINQLHASIHIHVKPGTAFNSKHCHQLNMDWSQSWHMAYSKDVVDNSFMKWYDLSLHLLGINQNIGQSWQMLPVANWLPAKAWNLPT